MHPTNRRKQRNRALLSLGLAAWLLMSCGETGDDAAAPEPGPDLIVFRQTNLQPEGIEYDARRGRFVVGSRTEGTIHTVDDSGTIEVLVANPGLSSTLGMQIDDDRLLVAGALGANRIGLGIYDLQSGATLHVVDLGDAAGGGNHLANDVAVDHDGNAYVTDTLSPVIYRVTPDGEASRFAEDVRFTLLNGIEFHPDGYLLVARLTGPRLLRVPVDMPTEVAEVATSLSATADGMLLRPDGSLVLVSSALAPDGTVLGTGVTLLTSGDGWQSASFADSWVATGGPTTAAGRGNDVHVIYAHLFDTSREEYEIVKVDFEAD